MAGYESLCELFFMSKCYFDGVNPLEPNFLVLDNNDIHRVRSKIVKIIKIFEKLEHLKTNRPQSGVIFFSFSEYLISYKCLKNSGVNDS